MLVVLNIIIGDKKEDLPSKALYTRGRGGGGGGGAGKGTLKRNVNLVVCIITSDITKCSGPSRAPRTHQMEIINTRSDPTVSAEN